MLVMIGSKALQYHITIRSPADIDLVGTPHDIINFKKNLSSIQSSYPVKKGKTQLIQTATATYNCEVVKHQSSSEYLLDLVKNDVETQEIDGFLIPSIHVLYMLKMSHRYLKNSPDFLKTMQDIHIMREHGAMIKPEHMEFYNLRQKETYNYGHPKLNVKKSEFFSNDGVNYVYEHDTIHESTKTMDKPAYAYFKPDESEVFCSREMFYNLDESIRLAAVLEESQVLALERSQVPFKGHVTPRKSFEIALMKVATSVTSGWFREYAWENYDKVKSMYNPNYVTKFWEDVEKGIVRKIQLAA